ncbi:GNAT family N-acetyltransferase [Falsibacillus albus]|uniref:GNAT family N-acetyltransferase n=1 Tax=Falsibacillus albus TaxID=2478915 RepID=A0A3L7JYN4_9BACI|nr:GNAT family N-acetyltransferase [Falsibacillus albus]RLQ95917.1 GNAT family N-acetyltransferase [Falsibacillus albus]
MIVKRDSILVRELEEKDVYLLSKWLSDPAVLQYYEGRDRPHNQEMIYEHYYSRERDLTGCIIEYNQKEIGYLQFYPLSNHEKAEYGYGEQEKLFGMDQFIGEPEYWNRGIGTKLIRMMISHIKDCHHPQKLIMDPQEWNERALRCYEKCGFRRVKLMPKHEFHEGELRNCWLIEYVFDQPEKNNGM